MVLRVDTIARKRHREQNNMLKVTESAQYYSHLNFTDFAVASYTICTHIHRYWFAILITIVPACMWKSIVENIIVETTVILMYIILYQYLGIITSQSALSMSQLFAFITFNGEYDGVKWELIAVSQDNVTNYIIDLLSRYPIIRINLTLASATNAFGFDLI